MAAAGINTKRGETVGGVDPPTAAVARRRRLIIADANGGNPYQLWVNPQQFSQREGPLASIQHTADGGVVNHWGPDFPRISFSGTTGRGYYPQLKELRDRVRDNYQSVSLGTPPWMRFYNFIDLEAWYVVITNFELKKSVDQPMLYGYAIEMTCVRLIVGLAIDDVLNILHGNNDVDDAANQISEALTT